MKKRKPQTRSMSTKQILAITLATVGGLQLGVPLATPLLHMAETPSIHAEQSGEMSSHTWFDDLFFQTAYAYTSEVTKENSPVKGETLEQGDSQTVNSGGQTIDATINGGGIQTVHDGQTIHTTVNSGGTQNVFYSTASGPFINGVATGTIVNSGGKLVVSGGKVLDTILNDGYIIDISTKETLTTVDGKVKIENNKAENVTLNRGAALSVSRDGSSYNTLLNGGTEYIKGGGTAYGAVSFYGDQVIQAGGRAEKTKLIGYWGRQVILAGGNAIDTITEGGDVVVQGTTENTTINNTGVERVEQEGIAKKSIVNSGGILQITDKGVADGTIVNSGGRLHLSAAGKAINVTLNDGYVLDANTDDFLTTTDGKIGIQDKVAKNITLNENAIFRVNSGGTVDGITVNNKGYLEINNGKVLNATLNEGYLLIASTDDTLTTIDGKVKIENKTAENITLTNHGKYGRTGALTVKNGGTALNTVVNEGVLIVEAGGTAKSTILRGNGGQLIMAGGSQTDTKFDGGGTQGVDTGAVVDDMVVNNGGTQEVYGTVNRTVVSDGTLRVGDGGKAYDVVLNKGYKLDVTTDAELTVKDSDMKISNGVAQNMKLNTGDAFTVGNGGKAENTTVAAGATLVLRDNSSATNTTLQDGYVLQADTNATLDVKGQDGVYIKDKKANGITLNNGGMLLVGNTGAATDTTVKKGGILAIAQDATVTGTTLEQGAIAVQGDKAYLHGTTWLNYGQIWLADMPITYTATKATKEAAMSIPGREVTIEDMRGSADFIINTDIVNGASDQIKIEKATDSKNNTVRINADPSVDQSAIGKVIQAKENTIFAEAPKDVVFTAKESENELYRYIPKVGQNADGKWIIENITVSEENVETPQAALEMAGNNIASMRIENNNVMKRMGELRGKNGDAGIWARVYGGKQDMNGLNGRDVEQKYTATQVGYDRRHATDNGAWYTGVTVGYLKGDVTMPQSSGEHKSLSFGLYGTWVGESGHYADIIVKQSKLKNNYTTAVANGDFDQWGTSFGVEYGYRKQLHNGFYFEPQAELTYSHIGSVDYAFGQARVKNDAMNSLIGRIGIAYGRKTDALNYYAKVSVLKEFSAESKATVYAGNNSVVMQDEYKQTWLEFTLGINGKMGENSNGYLELTRTNGGKITTPWQINAGVRWSL